VHRQALLVAATSGNPKFFLGTDSAPHATTRKESSCGCAGVFTAHAAVELYAEAFDRVRSLDRLQDFASSFGADHYGLPRSTTTLTLEKKSWRVPKGLDFGDGLSLTPLRAGDIVRWSIVAAESGLHSGASKG
jgi:dihydroorotase